MCKAIVQKYVCVKCMGQGPPLHSLCPAQSPLPEPQPPLLLLTPHCLLQAPLPSGFRSGLANGRHQWEIGGWRRVRLGPFFPLFPCSLPRLCGCVLQHLLTFPSLSLQTWADRGFLLDPGCLKIHLGSLSPACTS